MWSRKCLQIFEKVSNNLEGAYTNLEVQIPLKNQVCQRWAPFPSCNKQPTACGSCSCSPDPRCPVSHSLAHSLVPLALRSIAIYHLQLPCCFSVSFGCLGPISLSKAETKEGHTLHPLPLETGQFSIPTVALHVGFLFSLGFRIGAKFLCLAPSLPLAKTNTT